jgi:hypothetical protein
VEYSAKTEYMLWSVSFEDPAVKYKYKGLKIAQLLVFNVLKIAKNVVLMFSSLLKMSYTFSKSFELIWEKNMLKITIRNCCALLIVLTITFSYDVRIN